MRDYLDVDAALARYTRAQLLGLAAARDPGFDSARFREALAELPAHPRPGVRQLRRFRARRRRPATTFRELARRTRPTRCAPAGMAAHHRPPDNHVAGRSRSGRHLMRWIDDFAENPASAAKLGLNPTSPAACTHSYLRVRLAGRRQWPWLVPPVAYGMLAGRLRGRTDNIATARVRSDDGDWLSVTASIGVAAVDDVRGEFDHVLAAAHAAKSST